VIIPDAGWFYSAANRLNQIKNCETDAAIASIFVYVRALSRNMGDHIMDIISLLLCSTVIVFNKCLFAQLCNIIVMPVLSYEIA